MASTSTGNQHHIAGWVIIAGTVTMAAGTAVGGAFGTFVDRPLDEGTTNEEGAHRELADHPATR